MNIKIFFFTLFQNFMVPLDSSWWDLFKSAESPQFTINLPSLFGTYLWIFFIFTSVPILKKSCYRKNQIFSRNIIPSGEHREWAPLVFCARRMNNVHGITGASAVAWDRHWSQATKSLDLLDVQCPCGKGVSVVFVSLVMRHCARSVERCSAS